MAKTNYSDKDILNDILMEDDSDDDEPDRKQTNKKETELFEGLDAHDDKKEEDLMRTVPVHRNYDHPATNQQYSMNRHDSQEDKHFDLGINRQDRYYATMLHPSGQDFEEKQIDFDSKKPK